MVLGEKGSGVTSSDVMILVDLVSLVCLVPVR
jgi:hypothetical protein